MSVVAWANVRKAGATDAQGLLLPAGMQGFRACETRRFPEANEDIISLPDARMYRSLSRTGLLLLATSMPGLPAVRDFLAEDPYSVGIYCAIEQGLNDYESAKQMIDTPAEEFASSYKRLRSAKQYLNQLPSVPPSQLAILMGVMGPQYVYQHSRLAPLHALEQAESDLHENVVQAAIVCASFTLEDPLINWRVLQAGRADLPLSEGAATLILQRGGQWPNWTECKTWTPDANYGIAELMIGAAIYA